MRTVVIVALCSSLVVATIASSAHSGGLRARRAESYAQAQGARPRAGRALARDLRGVASRVSRVPRSLDLAEVQRAIVAARPALVRCYERALRARPNLRAAVAPPLRLRVGVDGRVIRVSLTTNPRDASLERCMSNALLRMRFAPFDGGEVELSVPLHVDPT
jgi:hypothetical protein